jgi:cold-inducible RNA-binding protein
LKHSHATAFRPLWAWLVLRDSFSRRPNVATKLYVGNLSYEVTDNDLQTLFSPHGAVQSAQVIMDRDTGRSKGFGFVEMNNGDEAQAAIKALNGQQSNGRSLNVSEARPREDRGASRRDTASGARRY